MWQDHNLAFASTVGTPLDDDNVRRQFRVIYEAELHAARHRQEQAGSRLPINVVMGRAVCESPAPGRAMIRGSAVQEYPFDQLVTHVWVRLGGRVNAHTRLGEHGTAIPLRPGVMDAA